VSWVHEPGTPREEPTMPMNTSDPIDVLPPMPGPTIPPGPDPVPPTPRPDPSPLPPDPMPPPI
jgi:hypothetical protein